MSSSPASRRHSGSDSRADAVLQAGATAAQPMSSAIFESAIQRFEENWTASKSFAVLVAAEELSTQAEVFRELACIDMEFRWRAGTEPDLETYLTAALDRGVERESLQEMAFEDFRLRARHGQPRPREAYAERWSLDVSRWPIWEPSVENATATGELPSVSSRQLDSGRAVEWPQLGSSFHGYRLVGLLGRGAFGCVYLGRQEGLANRFVVLKVTPLGDHEPQLLAELQHTHIVPIYSVQKDCDWQSICMPFLGLVTLAELRPAGIQSAENGQSLLSTIAARKADTIAASARVGGQVPADVGQLLQPERLCRLPAIKGMNGQRTLLWMFARIAEALAFAHSRGIVHGDIKPANILVSDDGNPLLLDFHLASRMSEWNAKEFVGGTLPYMSPQQLRTLESGQPLDASSDLFSLGVVMYELLGGSLPYPSPGNDRESLAAMIEHRRQLPKSLRKLNPSISVDVESIVEACLTQVGAERYASLQELQEDLDSQLADLPLRHAANRSVRERLSKWTRRHPVLTSTWSLAGLFLLVTAVVGMLLNDRLQKTRRLEADVSSREFVERIGVALLPLEVPGLDRKTVADSQQKLLEVVESYYQNPAYPGPDPLGQPQADREAGQLSSAAFWWARSALSTIDSAGSPLQKQEQIRSLNDQLSAVIKRIPAERAGAWLEFEQRLRQTTEQSEVELDAISDWLNQFPEPNGAENFTVSRLLASARALGRGDWQTALAELDRVLAVDADNFQAWLLKGHTHLMAGRRELASEAYSFCIGLRRDSPWGWFQRGLVRLESADYRGSYDDFSRCLELQPDEATAWLNRALAARGLQNFEAAVEDLTKAIELGCSETRAWYLRYQLNQQLNRTAEAERDLKRFLELEPSDVKSWLARGLAQVRLNQPQQALADFEAGLKLAPKSIDAWQNIAAIQSEYLDAAEKGAEALGQIIALQPNDPVPLVTRGVLWGRMGKRESAHADAIAALKLRSDADILFRAAGVFALTSRIELQDADKSIVLLRDAAFADPQLVLKRIEGDSDLELLRERFDYYEILASLYRLAGKPNPPSGVKE